MTGRLPRDVHATFVWGRSWFRTSPVELLHMVDQIETLYRERFGLERCSDDGVVELTGESDQQTAKQVAALRVIRACVGLREDAARLGVEALAESGWPDILQAALHEADPDRVLGADQIKRNRAGGSKGAETKQREARERDAKLLSEAEAIRKSTPGIKTEAVAAMLNERGLGGTEAIRKKLMRRRKT